MIINVFILLNAKNKKNKKNREEIKCKIWWGGKLVK